ncbi:LOW QUALITY PROTEIN: zinc transporter ZIP10 [Aplochiton taeniatus]
MRVHTHTKFCLLCVLTFLFHQCSHCHGDKEHHHRQHDHTDSDHVDHNNLQISQAPYIEAATAPLGPGSLPDDSLAAEKSFYIQQLFRRYGQRDTLDFRGFQSLLLNLGLGEVKVVGLDHEDLGHDHVAHLDLLEVQEGLHSHSDTHGHGQGHSHHKPHSHHHQTHTEQGPSKCSQQTMDASPTADGGSLGEDHHDHDTEQTNDQDPPPGHHEDQNTSEPDHNHPPKTPHSFTGQEPTPTQQQTSQGPQIETGAPEIPSLSIQPTVATLQPETRPKRPRKPGRAKAQQGQHKAPSPLRPLSPQHDDHDHDHGHGHEPNPGHQRRLSHEHGHSHNQKAKREVPVPGPVLPWHPEGLSHKHEQCLNLTELLSYYGLSPDSLISPSQFTYLCPALLYQIDSRVCIRHYHNMDVEPKAAEQPNTIWVWLWGFVSITIISLLSLLGVVLVPILKQSCFKFLLTFLVALAVGTLSGDALLHLLPHSQSNHDRRSNEESQEKDLLVDFDGVWKGLTALGGISLFIIEHCIGMFQHYREQGGSLCGRRKKGEEAKIGRKLSDHKLNRRSDAEWLHLKPLTEGGTSTVVSCDNGHNDTQLSELQLPDSPTTKTPLAPALADSQQSPREDGSPARDNGRKAKKHGHSHSHGHSHGGHCHSDQEMKDAGIASIAWMVIMGDGMHNFSDGLAIGAAFSANITGGISTSVAVFCHELPHELGDFAVLLKAGMSVKQAIVYNLLSALMAYVGMVIGTAVGTYTHNVTSWIFAVTAGMFLYVALVDMLPEMLHGDSEDHKRCQLGHFALQNVGLLTGFAIMLLIAIFEEDIVIDFGF